MVSHSKTEKLVFDQACELNEVIDKQMELPPLWCVGDLRRRDGKREVSGDSTRLMVTPLFVCRLLQRA